MTTAEGIIVGLRRMHRLGSPSDMAAQWLAPLLSQTDSDLGLLAYYGPGGLLEAGERIVLCQCDAPLLTLARNACLANQNIAFSLPPCADLFPLLVATKLLLGSLLESVCHAELHAEGSSTFRLNQGASVLIVSPNVEMRSRYASTSIAQEPLLQKYPSYRLRPDGSAVRISRVVPGIEAEDEQALYFFLARQRVLPAQVECAPAIIVLDFLHGRWGARAAEFLRWANDLGAQLKPHSRIISFVPLEDEACERAVTDAGILMIPIDHHALEESHSAFVRPAGSLRNNVASRLWSVQTATERRPDQRDHRIVTIEGAEALTQRIAEVELLLRPYRDLDQRDLRMVRWLTAIMAQLACPLAWYEQSCRGRTLRMLIDGLGRTGLDPALKLSEIIGAARSHLEAAYELLRHSNPKSDVLLKSLTSSAQSLQTTATIGVVVRDRVMADATRAWIYTEQKTLRERVSVLYTGALDSETDFSSVFICGPWPLRYRWQLIGGVASQLSFLSYPGEDRIVEAQIARIVGETSIRRRFNLRENAILTLGTGDTAVSLSPDSFERKDISLPLVLPTRLERTTVTCRPPSWQDVNFSASPNEHNDAPFYWSDPIDDLDEPNNDTEDMLAMANVLGASLVLCVEVTLRSRSSSELSWLYLEPDRSTDVLVPEADEFVSTKNRDMEPGMTIVGSDDGKRHSIFDQLLELAHATPDLRPLKAMHENWVEAIGLCASRFRTARGTVDYVALLAALRQEGVGIKDVQALRYWVTQTVIGPGDVNSIRAVGRVSGHPVLSGSAALVDRALNGIRSVHQQVGRRLSAVLRESAAQAVSETASRKPLAKNVRGSSLSSSLTLTIPLDEMIDAMEFWTVEAVERETRQVPSILVGRYMSARWHTT